MVTDIREVVGTGFGPIRMDRYMHTQTDEDHFYSAPQPMSGDKWHVMHNLVYLISSNLQIQKLGHSMFILLANISNS